jgi:chromosome segregation ATPase
MSQSETEQLNLVIQQLKSKIEKLERSALDAQVWPSFPYEADGVSDELKELIEELELKLYLAGCDSDSAADIISSLEGQLTECRLKCTQLEQQYFCLDNEEYLKFQDDLDEQKDIVGEQQQRITELRSQVIALQSQIASAEPTAEGIAALEAEEEAPAPPEEEAPAPPEEEAPAPPEAHAPLAYWALPGSMVKHNNSDCKHIRNSEKAQQVSPSDPRRLCKNCNRGENQCN